MHNHISSCGITSLGAGLLDTLCECSRGSKRGRTGNPHPLKLEYMLRPLPNWKVLDPRLNEAYIGHTCVHGTHVEHDLIKCCQAACEQSVALFILRSFVKQFVSMQATAVSCNEPTHLGEIAFKTVKGGGGGSRRPGNTSSSRLGNVS